ncbi:hypothetical protein [Nocardiopsis sp. YSL2]|nr:hypothetical protein [Nocardiopsis sp. YSL2]
MLDGTTGNAVVAPEASVSDGTGLTVAVELGDPADQVADVTV